MNAPFMGKFKVTQTQHSAHDGFDMVPYDDKNVYSTVSGTVVYAGWQNASVQYGKNAGFGQYVCIKSDADGLYYYFGHLSEISVNYGAKVKITDKIGVVGHTGYCIPEGEGGTHLHYCARKQFAVGNAADISAISGIPNAVGEYDDGYRFGSEAPKQEEKKKIKVTIEIDDHIYSGLLE